MTKTNSENVVLLNLGCGATQGKHWQNLDSSPNVLLDKVPLLKNIARPLLPASSRSSVYENVKYMDLRKNWKFDDCSIDGIFSSHFFEHLDLKDGEHVLNECFRVLKPGCSIRFILPSVLEDVNFYLAERSKGNPLAASVLAERLACFLPPPNGPFWYRFYFSLYDKNRHKMIYDYESLAHLFEKKGFHKIVSKQFMDSDLPWLSEVEKPDRLHGAVCIEAKKPSSEITQLHPELPHARRTG